MRKLIVNADDFGRHVLIKSLNPSNKIPQLNLGTGILKI